MLDPGAEVKAFLARYADAFVACDGARIGALYNVPCLTLRADGSIHAFTAREETQAFFQRLADGYRREGARAWAYAGLLVLTLGRRSVLASLEWEMRRADGGAIRQWRQSYNLVDADGGLRILASTFHL